MRKLLLAALILIGLFSLVTLEQWFMMPKEVQAQTNTFCASNLACTVTGIWTFSAVSSFNAVKYVSSGNPQGWGGADLAAWIASAFTSCPNGGACTVFVTNGSYPTPSASIIVGVSPCVNYPSAQAQTLIFDTGVTFTENFPIKVNCGGYLAGNGLNPFATGITAGASLPAGPMIDIGDNVNLINAGVSYIKLNCNSIASCTGIRARGIQDLSYIKNSIVVNYLTNCILIDGTGVGAGNFSMEENFCGAATGAGDGIFLNSATGGGYLKRNSVVSNSGVAISAAGIRITNATSNGTPIVLIHNHTEKHTDGVSLDVAAPITVIEQDSTNGTTNTVHIKATATGSIVALQSHSNANSGSNPVILNDVTTTSILSTQPNGMVLEYKWMNGVFEYWVDTVGLHWSPNSSAQSIFSKARIEGIWHLSDQGGGCTNGELALSAGWQSTGSATVTAAAGNGPQTCSWTITTGTTTAANPTITDTLTSALPNATTVCWMNIYGGTHVAVAGESLRQTTLSATAPIFTANFTPTNTGATYFITRGCGP